MSNNPFAANDPNTQNILNPFNQDPSQRFPSINDQNQQQPQIQYAPPMQQQQQQQQQPQYGQVQQQQPTYMNPQATGFQPQSSFGQSLAYEMNSYSTIKDLDPYGSIPGTWAQHQQQPPRNGHSPSISSPSNNAYGAHPRTVVENNKNALERWDNSSWKLLFGKMDDLKRSWESRKRQILIALESQGGRMLGYEEQQRFQSVSFSFTRFGTGRIDIIAKVAERCRREHRPIGSCRHSDQRSRSWLQGESVSFSNWI